MTKEEDKKIEALDKSINKAILANVDELQK